MSKATRVRSTVASAEKRPVRAKDLIDRLLAEMRVSGCFRRADDRHEALIDDLTQAFRRFGWGLTQEGELTHGAGMEVVSAAGRPAIEEQLQRLLRVSDDTALLLGTAKEMLESTAKYVLEQFGVEYAAKTDFPALWYLARYQLGLLPENVDKSADGGIQVLKVYGAAWTIIEQTNELRNHFGTGHGRTLPTAVTPEAALFIVRQACSIVDLTFATLDRQFGR